MKSTTIHFKKGFSLSELLVVLAVLGVLFSIAWKSVGSFSEKIVLDSTKDSVVSTLYRAKNNAIARKDGTSWGVFISSTSATLFSGSSYATRIIASDSSMTFSKPISVSGQNEILFQKDSGYITIATSTTLTRGRTSTVTVSQKGVISH